MLSGSVGAGKSTLLRQIYDKYSALGYTTVWLKLEPEISLGAELFSYLLEALYRVGIITQADKKHLMHLVNSRENDIQYSFRELRASLTEGGAKGGCVNRQPGSHF